LAIVLALAAPGFAARFKGSSGGVVMTYRPTPPNPHEKAARDALREVTRAQDEVSRACRDQRRAFENSPEWHQAAESARNARTKLDTARRGALAKHYSSQSYKTAQLEIWKLQQSLDTARAQEKPDRQKISALAGELLRRRSELSKAESDLLNADESVREARYALIDAEAQIAALRRSFRESVQMNQQWREARSRLDDARTRLAAVGD
jgi:hypothetical protein